MFKKALLPTIWILALLMLLPSIPDLFHYAGFTFVGIVGAIFANSTGAGGGVVFVPFFNYLGFNAAQVVATSFAIQCFGMTAGAISWSRYYRNIAAENDYDEPDYQWHTIKRLLLLTAIPSVVGLLIVQRAGIASPASLATVFAIFSIVLAISLFISLRRSTHQAAHINIQKVDFISLPLISLIGGGITAWLSVGVGEIIALYLILRGFGIVLAVATAVVLSAISVWFGVIEHTLINYQVVLPVLAFAGPGALIGGLLARKIALAIPVEKLKLFFAVWVFLMGISHFIL